MNTERDELAEALEDVIEGGDDSCYDDMASALIMRGYTKPRQVTTVEELDALPDWSVVRSEQATIWENINGRWAETLSTGKHPSEHIALPATVLYSPVVGA